MAEEKTEAKETKAKGGSKGKLIIIAVVVLLVAGVAVMKFMGGGKTKKKTTEDVKVGEALQLDEFLVNLKNDHYLRITLALGLREGLSPESYKTKLAPIRDAIILCLSDRTMDELSPLDGKMKLAAEIKEKVNLALAGKDYTADTGKSSGGDSKSDKSDSSDNSDTDSKHKKHKKDSASDSSDNSDETDQVVVKVYFSAFAMQ